MATHTSVEGTFTVGGTAVGSLRTMNLETSAETIDATTITSTAKIVKAGTSSFYWFRRLFLGRSGRCPTCFGRKSRRSFSLGV